METRKLIQNAVYIPEDDVYIKSLHVHDYRSYTTKSGKEVSVDGGLEYSRRTFTLNPDCWFEYNLYSNDPFELICEKLLWGTRGVDGKSPLTFKPIRLLESDHLINILANVPNIDPLYIKVIKYWIAEKFYE